VPRQRPEASATVDADDHGPLQRAAGGLAALDRLLTRGWAPRGRALLRLHRGPSTTIGASADAPIPSRRPTGPDSRGPRGSRPGVYPDLAMRQGRLDPSGVAVPGLPRERRRRGVRRSKRLNSRFLTRAGARRSSRRPPAPRGKRALRDRPPLAGFDETGGQAVARANSCKQESSRRRGRRRRCRSEREAVSLAASTLPPHAVPVGQHGSRKGRLCVPRAHEGRARVGRRACLATRE
jgi:hypothetical protein